MSPRLSFDHLTRLTTPLGLYEHALGTTPRVEHAYCVDDVARGLVVTARVPSPSVAVQRLSEGYLSFVLTSMRPDGLVHNRRRVDGSWRGRPSSDDHWGRALWALGVAAVHLDDPNLATRALIGASTALRARSRWPRAMAYAALGAAQIADCMPAAVRMLEDARSVLPRLRTNADWPWPEDRLTYANAVLPEAMMVIGRALEDDEILDEGLFLLDWLVDQQTVDAHLSVVPTTGWSRKSRQRGYAQQPIEVAALAEACRVAYEITADTHWADVIDRSVAWFAGDNDGGVAMSNPVTGGGFDGLERTGASANQGAESTLAWLSTAQVALMPQLAVAR